MKIFTILIVFFVGQDGFFSNWMSKTAPEKKEKIQWMTIEEALAANEKEPKKILIDFYTDWCGWCRKMDAKTFGHPQIVEFVNENFYAVKFNAEQGKSVMYKDQEFKSTPSRRAGTHFGTHEFAYLMANNNGRIGYPTVTFLDENSDKITFVPSYLEPKDMDAVLKYISGNFYEKVNWGTFTSNFKSRIE